jgi:AcrR family transcriptional regulator
MESHHGRRERKKAATRKALSDTAVHMFIARGFDNVSVREIAEAVDVSTTTLMNHFPTKEALVFDRDDEIEQSLVAAVVDRGPKVSVLDALRAYTRKRASFAVPARLAAFMKLVDDTPALADYWQKMWMRHERVLARVLAKDLGRRENDLWCSAMARFVLDAIGLAERSRHPARMMEVAFGILEDGWRRRQ